MLSVSWLPLSCRVARLLVCGYQTLIRSDLKSAGRKSARLFSGTSGGRARRAQRALVRVSAERAKDFLILALVRATLALALN